MRNKGAILRRLAGPALLVALEIFAAGALLAAATAPAAAQWGFQQWFGGPSQRRQNNYGWPWQRQEPRREAPADYSRAPPPHKREAPATTNVVVLGDSMADWLGYGLEEAFAETPEIGVVRKPRANRGAGGVVDLIDQARRQLDELALLVERMPRRLHIEIGQHAQERRPDVDPLAAGERHQPVEAGK